MVLLSCFGAQAQFSLTGEIRPRTELYNGVNTSLAQKLDEPGSRIGVATQQRSRLYFSYQSEAGIKVVFTPQLVNFWGQMPQAYDLLGDGAPGAPETNFSVYEAYAEYKANEMYTLKVGRQAISYGDQRWFGALGWAASGRAHDAFVNKFSFGDVKLDVGIALNQTKHVNALDSAAISAIRVGYKSLQYAWLTLPTAGALSLQAMITNVTAGAATSATEISYGNVTTFALLPSFKFSSDLSLNASVYGQLNENNKGIGYLLAADITYKGLGLPLTIGADVLSGTSAAEDGTNTWAQPFGTNHKFYGFMDFFYVGETVRGANGLTDLYAKAVVKTGSKTKLIIMPHIFSSTLDVEQSGGSLGTEIDVVFNYNVAKGFNFKLGYSKFFATSLMETAYGGDKSAGNQWAWMQLTFKPTFLKSTDKK